MPESNQPAQPTSSMDDVRRARTDDEIRGCLPVLSQLRPSLTAETIVPRIRELEGGGFHLAYLTDAGGTVRAVAGYRFLDMLFSGPQLYVDDLVTDAATRSSGYGRIMHQWLLAEARRSGCKALVLDSGVHRHEAHRFYFRERMTIVGFHFMMSC